MKNLKLERAIKQYKNGCDDSFEYVYDKTYKVVFFVIYDVLGDKQLSEDVLQDTYLKVCQNINSYTSDNFLAWITRIAKNLAINEYNRRKKVQNVDIQDYDERFISEDENKDSTLIDTARKILDKENFLIINLSIISGYKLKEISQILNMPVSTVSYKLNQSLLKLKNYLEENKIV